MVARQHARKELSRFLNNRKGTAEIIGSVMFLVILLFFFTNVYMWHDSATREMNTVLSEKMNSRISVDWVSTTEHDGLLNVTNNGGSEVALSRLWIINQAQDHIYFDLEDQGIWVAAGAAITIEVGNTTGIHYDVAEAESFKILTALGNTAACSYTQFLTGSITVELEARPFNVTKSFSFSGTLGYFTLYSDALSSQDKIFETFSGLAPGTYVITESETVGWILEGIFGATNSSSREATVVVVGGQSYYVRFVNRQLP